MFHSSVTKRDELHNFGFRINKRSGTATYEWMVDQVHDDLVTSPVLAVWYSGRYDAFAVLEGYQQSDGTYPAWNLFD
jgi:hypothetical protein